ncbi:MAG: AAA family ATPase [Candidatus Aenigmatarchaeota archaeon]
MTRTIGIVAGKGGVGKTTVAINLACALGLLNKRVGLIDFNFTTSHLALEFGMLPGITLNNVLRNEVGIEKALYPVFNIYVVPASLNLTDLSGIETVDLKARIKNFMKDFEIVLLDSAPGFGREALTSIQTSDDIIIVANPTIASLVDAIKCKNLSIQLGVNPLGIILNKYKNRDFELKPKEVSQLVELPIIGIIKEDEDFLKSEAARIPLIFYKRKKAEEFVKIAHFISGIEYKPSFISRLKSLFY